MRGRPTQLLVEAAALQSADFREEEGVIALARLEVDRPIEQRGRDRAADVGLRGRDEGVERLLERAEPGAVVHEVSPLLIDRGLEVELLLGEGELLQVVMELQQHRRRGRLVELA